MLWETADPTEQLTRRFGFLDGPSAVGWVADSLQRQWQLQVTGCDRLVISAWNAMAWVTADDRRLIAKWSALPQLFANLLDAARVTTWLERCGLPVAAPIPATDDRLLVEVPTQAEGHVHARRPLGESRALLGVTPVVDGDLLDSDDLGQVTDAGQMLAAVHEALAAYPDEVGGRRPRGQEQLVHNDFRSANILHDGARSPPSSTSRRWPTIRASPTSPSRRSSSAPVTAAGARPATGPDEPSWLRTAAALTDRSPGPSNRSSSSGSPQVCG
jgi:homoserine kinase type II